MKERFNLVVACDLNRGIGKDNALPWKLPADMRHFKELTSTAEEGLWNAVIMGRKTWESIPPRFRPLPDRYNVVLTRDENYSLPEGVFKADSLDRAYEILSEGPVDNLFVIGGASIYSAAINHRRIGFLNLTEIRHVFDCDTFFPDYKSYFTLVSCSEIQEEKDLEFCFKVYKPNLLV